MTSFVDQDNVSFGDPWTAAQHNQLMANIRAVWESATDNQLLLFDTTDTIVAVPYLPGVSLLGAALAATTNDIVPSTDYTTDVTGTVITFDHPTTAIQWDDAGFVSTDAMDTVTIRYSGAYYVNFGGQWETTWSGVSEMWITINGAGPFGPNTKDASLGGLYGAFQGAPTYERQFTAGDTIQLVARQNSDANKELGFAYLRLRMTRRTT